MSRFYGSLCINAAKLFYLHGSQQPRRGRTIPSSVFRRFGPRYGGALQAQSPNAFYAFE